MKTTQANKFKLILDNIEPDLFFSKITNNPNTKFKINKVKYLDRYMT